MADIHRDTDPRVCGATTTVAGNTDVYANNLLVSVDADPNSHGDGALIAHSNEVYADNILTVNHTPDTANADSLCPVPPHCGPDTDGGSPDVCTGDPTSDPVVVLPPPVIVKIEARQAIIMREPFNIGNFPPIMPTDPVEVRHIQPSPITIREQQTIKHVPTPVMTADDIIEVEPIAQENAPAQTHEDLCHPFDGLLDQYLIEAKKGLWLEKGIVYDSPKTSKNKTGLRELPYFGAVSNKHRYQKPDGTADMEGEFQNQKILGIWKEIGYVNANVWYTDQTPWCMGFLNFVLKKAGYRYLQSATAKHLITKQAKYESTEITDFREAKCGDMCYWSSSHVNFVYSNDSDAQSMSFVGGNQNANALTTLVENNPAGGTVSHNWAGTAPSPYNPKGKKGGKGAYNYGRGTPHDTMLLKIFRPKKIS